MSEFPVEELVATLTQSMTASKAQSIEAVRLHIYKHNSPAGSLIVKIKDSNGGVLATSNTVTISSISSAAFFHGYIRFDLNHSFLASDAFNLELSSSGYTFAESAYIGWVKDMSDNDYRKYSTGYTPNIGFVSPLDCEFWERKKVTRGIIS